MSIGNATYGDFVVDTESEMLNATDAVIGSTCLRLDIDPPNGVLYICTALPATVPTNWTPFEDTIGGGGGAATANYNWSTATSGAPASGVMRTNAAPNIATFLALNVVSAPGNNIGTYLRTITPGDRITLQVAANLEQYVQYQVNGAFVDNTTWIDFPVTVIVALSFNPANATPLITQVDHTATNVVAASDVSIVDSGGYYTATQVEGALQEVGAALPLKAPLASPALTGNPTTPNQAAASNNTRIANTAYVDGALSGKANISSPAFTGTPTAPTALAGTNNTQLATTAYVDAAVAAAPAASSVITNYGIFNGAGDYQIMLGKGVALYIFLETSVVGQVTVRDNTLIDVPIILDQATAVGSNLVIPINVAVLTGILLTVTGANVGRLVFQES